MSKQTDLINVTDAITVSGSNVGIGTTSPSAKLDVGGVIQFLDDNTPEIKIIDPDDSNYALIGYSDGTMTLSSNHGNEAGGANVLKMFTGGSERMRIDSSGNLLVGKTSTGLSVTGTQITSDGRLMVTRDGNQAADFNRKSSDGDIVKFQKDGTTVGSIGSNGTASWIACPAGSGAGLRFDGDDSRIVPTEGDGTNRNAAVDLGYSSSRFKDLYLSGGVYLGGTGSANKLDDYEEGTWTPLITGSGNSIVSGTAVGRYVKIGETVFVWMTLNNNASNTYGSSVITFSGLPFTSQPSSSGNPVPLTTPVFYRYVTPPSGANQLVTYVSGSYNHLELYWTSQNNWAQFTGSHINNDASFALYVGAIYRTNL